MCSLAVTGSLSASPSIAARASFILPATWGRELGVANASYGLGFSVSAASPCLDLAVSQRNQSAPAIDLFNKGVLTADQVHLLLAPTGCRLPAKLPGQPTEEIPAGFQISFDGSLLHTPVNLFAAMTRSGSSFKIDANLRVGRFALGPVTFDADTVLDVLADPGSSTYRFGLKTSARIGGAAFKIDASFSAANNTIELHARNIELNFDLLLASFKGKMSFDFVQTPQRTQASFTGHLDVDLRILTLGVDVNALVYDSAAGGLQSLNMAARTSFKIGPASGSIDGSVTYEKAKSQIGLALGGSVSLWGFKTAFNLPATLSTNISLPFSFGSDADTTRISPPGSIIVLRLKGFTTGHLDQRGAVDIDKPVPIQACFPFETVCFTISDARVDRATGAVTFQRSAATSRWTRPSTSPPKPAPSTTRRGRVHGQRSVRQVPRCAPGSLPGRHKAMMYGCNSTNAQKFKLLADGSLRVGDGKLGQWCATVKDREVTIGRCAPDKAFRRWYRDELGRIRDSQGTGHPCLDIQGRSSADGAFAELATCTHDQSQRWVLGGYLRQPGHGCWTSRSGTSTRTCGCTRCATAPTTRHSRSTPTGS